MFEEMIVSAVQLLLILFGVILFFILVYGALWMRTTKRARMYIKNPRVTEKIQKAE